MIMRRVMTNGSAVQHEMGVIGSKKDSPKKKLFIYDR